MNVQSARLEETTSGAPSFDAITLWDVIEHVPDPLDTMRRVASLLKPGGVVMILTPNLGSPLRARLLQGRAPHRLLAGGRPAWAPVPVLRRLTWLLERVGLTVLEIEHEPFP